MREVGKGVGGLVVCVPCDECLDLHASIWLPAWSLCTTYDTVCMYVCVCLA